jgi:hypothetical protein
LDVHLLPYFEWLESLWVGNAIRQSLWLFPVIEAIHLLGLCLLGGAVLVVDLRMMGVGIRQSISEVAREARPWLIIAITVMLATGIPLFLSEAIKCYYNTSFWVKITTLPFAILYAFTIRDRVAKKSATEATATTKVVALVSIALWFTVAAAGRWIGFS